MTSDSEADFLPSLSLAASGIRHFFGGGGAAPKSNIDFNFTLPLVYLVALFCSLDLFFFVSLSFIHHSQDG